MKKASAVTYVFDETDIKALIRGHLTDVENETGEVKFEVDIGTESVGRVTMERDETVFRGIKATVKNTD